MKKTDYISTQSPSKTSGIYLKLCAAAIIYTLLAIYIYQPYLADFKPRQFLIILNSIIAALGCFVLTRRWLTSFWASIFAGAIYGFSPFALGFAAYHPFAGISLAMTGWLFCPAAFWTDWTRLSRNNFQAKIITTFLSILPFLIIGLFFWTLAHRQVGPFFPLPKNLKLYLLNMTGLVVPLAMEPHNFIFGFYHIPTIVGLMGFFIYFSSRRTGALIIALAGLFLAAYDSILQVSPIVWALIPMLFCSVMTGLGTQAIAWAGQNDRKWILICTVIAVALAAATYYLSFRFHSPYLEAAKMYTTAAVLMATIFFMAKAKVRWHFLRWLILCTALGIDILAGAKAIVDQIF